MNVLAHGSALLNWGPPYSHWPYHGTVVILQTLSTDTSEKIKHKTLLALMLCGLYSLLVYFHEFVVAYAQETINLT